MRVMFVELNMIFDAENEFTTEVKMNVFPNNLSK